MNWSETGAHQTAHAQANRLEKPSYLAIPAFAQCNAVPAIGAGIANMRVDPLKCRPPVVELDPVQQPAPLARTKPPERANCVFAQHPEPRMHHPICELSRIGE